MSKLSKPKSYLCIDLKSFYASVECAERGLNPFETNLVVADPERSEGTICLAITPAMKALGIKNRCRVFEIPKSVKYIMAEPRMQLYIDYSANIYGIYLKYISKDDIHVYSIDEAFLDVTDYLEMYGMSDYELARKIMKDILETTGITATCGIGTNLYLAKVALDITAKHSDDNIGILNEEIYRKKLWKHQPVTDFWQIGTGIAKRLESIGIRNMQEIAQADEKILFKKFGIDAELLIDHAWGREGTTIADIKAYRPKKNSISTGQVLFRDYKYEEGRLIVKEMTDLLCLDLVEKGLMTTSATLQIGYSRYFDMPHARGTIGFGTETSSAIRINEAVVSLYEEITDKNIPVRRVTITFNNAVNTDYQQYNLFISPEDMDKEKRLQEAVISIKKKYGKNAILKGMNLLEGGTTIERNRQIGGHKRGS